MSLSKEQQQDLNKIKEHLKKIERFAIENNLDLDVFMTQYNDKGIAVYGTEKISLEKGKAEKRKKVFEKTDKEKTKSAIGKHLHL